MTDALCQNIHSKSRDPALRYFATETIKLAQAAGASQEVLQSVKKGLELAWKGLKFEEDNTTEESPAVKNIVEKTNTNDWKKVYEEGKTQVLTPSTYMSNRTEGQFLKSYVSAFKPKSILEIGMFTGFTALCMAEALSDDAKIITVDQDDYFKEFVTALIQQSPHKNKIQIVIGKAIELMKQMIAKGTKFDMAFLDSDDAEFAPMVKLLFNDNLLAPGGTVLVDNAVMDGESYLVPTSHGYNFAKMLREDPNLHVVMVPIRDGIFLIRRRADVDGGIY